MNRMLRLVLGAAACVAAPLSLPASSCGQEPEAGTELICEPWSDWSLWWDYNQDRFLEMRLESYNPWGPQPGEPPRRAGQRTQWGPRLVREEDIYEQILPALKRALDGAGEGERDLVITAMMAMAKIGTDHPDFRLASVLRARLASGDQEIQEAATLALGVAGHVRIFEPHADPFELLRGLALDDKIGRTAVGAPAVSERTRTFAAYGLGLLASQTPDVEARRRLLVTLKALLENEPLESRELRVATIHGLSLLRREGDDEAQLPLLAGAVAVLESYYLRSLGEDQELVQAHCPTAIARLLGRGHSRSDYYRDLFARGLVGDGEPKRAGAVIARSCVLALGRLCRPNVDKESADARFSELLLEQHRHAADEVTRCYAALALGEIGGARNRTHLLAALPAARGPSKSWCALALGILSFDAYREQELEGMQLVRDTVVGEALLAEFQATEGPALQGALAIAMGLNRYLEAVPRFRELLGAGTQQPHLLGYLPTAVGLMNDLAAIDDLRAVLASASRRPELFERAAVALSRLGDRQLTASLLQGFKETAGNLARIAAIAMVLGHHSDRESVEPLKVVMLDRERDQLVRAFAAMALGNVASKELLPWQSKIVDGINLSASVETLTNRATGVLDFR